MKISTTTAAGVPIPEYGTVWFPHVTIVGWAPYRYGHWAWISPWGWTWVDDAPWGFAPFHYGRWVFVARRLGLGALPAARCRCCLCASRSTLPRLLLGLEVRTLALALALVAAAWSRRQCGLVPAGSA